LAATGSVAKQMPMILNDLPGGTCARVMQGAQQGMRGAA
jgi:hypothetical protein